MRAVFAVLMLLLAGVPSWGQSRPRGAGRVVARFGFDGLPEDPSGVPEGWVRAQDDPVVPRDRPGFPLWNLATVELDRGGAAVGSGGGAVRLPTRGGSTSLLLKPGVVAILPDANYLISARVRTERLTHARAFVAARFLDQSGEAIAGSEARSGPVESGEWAPVAILMPGDFEGAVFLQVELLLLQPREFEALRLPDELHAWPQDVAGEAWFDELVVLQTPRVELVTGSDSNVFAQNTPPPMTLEIRDFTGEALETLVTVQDARGRVIQAGRVPFPGGRFRRSWVPPFEGFGWYRVILRASGPAGVLAATSADIVWAPPIPPSLSGEGEFAEERGGLGLLATSLAIEAFPAATEAVISVGLGSMMLPILDPMAGAEWSRARVGAFESALDRLGERRVSIGAYAGGVPPGIADSLGLEADDVLGLLAADPGLWEPYLGLAFDRLGPLVRRWALGADRSVGSGGSGGSGAGATAGVMDRLARLIPAPLISVARAPTLDRSTLEGWASLDSSAPGSTLRIPTWMGPEAIGELAAAIDRSAGAAGVEAAPIDLVFDGGAGGEAPRFSGWSRASGVMRQALEAWAVLGPAGLSPGAGADDGTSGAADAIAGAAGRRARVLLADPWRTDPRHPRALGPTPELAVWRTLAEAVVGRRVGPEIELAPGVAGLPLWRSIGHDPRGDAIAVWQRRATDRPARIEMRLAEAGVETIDPFGNRSSLEPVEIAPQVLAHRLLVSEEPVIIEGVDLDLIRFQASIRMDPDRLVSEHRLHRHRVVMENPFSVPVRGTIYVVEPGNATGQQRDRGWMISPRTAPFGARPGEIAAVDLDLRFSPAEPAGPKTFVFDLDIAAGRPYGRVRVVREVDLGLPGIELFVAHRRVSGDGSIVVEATLVNTGDQEVTVELIARAPGYARAETIVAQLGPGQSATRVFPFPDGARRLAGDRVAVAAVMLEAPGRLTRYAEIEP